MSATTLRTGWQQFVRYAVVGLVSNGVLYGLYLVMTQLGIGHKLAATIAYAASVLQTFGFNRAWSFHDRGLVGPAFARYVATYAFGYVVNMAVLMMLVDRAGLRHELVQAATIVLLAVMLFLLQKFWVFRKVDKRLP